MDLEIGLFTIENIIDLNNGELQRQFDKSTSLGRCPITHVPVEENNRRVFEGNID